MQCCNIRLTTQARTAVWPRRCSKKANQEAAQAEFAKALEHRFPESRRPRRTRTTRPGPWTAGSGYRVSWKKLQQRSSRRSDDPRATGALPTLNSAGSQTQCRRSSRPSVFLRTIPQVHAMLSQVYWPPTGICRRPSPSSEEALRLNASDADGWNNLGVLEARAGKPAAAREDFEHALRIAPDHARRESKSRLRRSGRQRQRTDSAL